MEDRDIVELYWQRSEHALEETAKKYGKYFFTIANNILGSSEDANEIVNDTYLGAWNSMPENRPTVLSSYLGKITRRLAIKRLEAREADKRGGGEVSLVLEELSGCISAGQSVERELEQAELSSAIDRFVMSLPLTERRVFLCRYWYLDSISDIVKSSGFSQSKVKSMLHRTRKKLKLYLEKEGVYDET